MRRIIDAALWIAILALVICAMLFTQGCAAAAPALHIVVFPPITSCQPPSLCK